MGLLFLVWLACFSLSVEDAFRQTAYEPFLLAPAGPGEYPIFLAPKVGLDGTGPMPARGDRVRSIGGVDLRGATPSEWIAASARFAGQATVLPVQFASADRVMEASVRAETYRRFWPRLVAAFLYVGCAIFLMFWARSSPLVNTIIWVDLLAGIFFSCGFAGRVAENQLAIGAHMGSLALVAPLAMRAGLMFPHGRLPTGPLERYGPWAFASLALFDGSRFYGTPFSHGVGALGSAVVGLAYVAIVIVVGARTYLSSGPIARRQMRWVFLASYVVTVPFTLAVVMSAFDPRFGSVLAVGISAFGILPIAVTIALVRFNLFDVDHLLGSAATYTVLTVVVLTATFWAVPALAEAVSTSTGVESTIAQMVLAFALALGLVRLHTWLRPRIDRVFFADRVEFEDGMQRLMRDLSDCSSPEDVAQTAGDRLMRGLRPESLVLFLETGDAMAPVFVEGRPPPTAVPRESPLVATLEASGRVVSVDAGASDPFGRAVLESLGVPVVSSIWGMGRLAGLLAFGEKRSGDVYTSTETALLAAVADKVGTELKRFDQDARLEASARLQARLRQYVDPHLADRLDRDEQIELGERELSILFSDLRNYTEYAQDRPLAEVYATVNRYAQAVSDIVHRHGGTVVDFAGDGVMAVFGAPTELEGKEQAAVAAALEIVGTVTDLGTLSPGVGIATGPAYVASVRGGGQLHWSALGDTTNLASRIQGLTRELGAWVVIDDATRVGARGSARGFRALGEVAVRGRTGAPVLHALLMDAENDSPAT